MSAPWFSQVRVAEGGPAAEAAHLALARRSTLCGRLVGARSSGRLLVSGPMDVGPAVAAALVRRGGKLCQRCWALLVARLEARWSSPRRSPPRSSPEGSGATRRLS